MNEVKTQKEKFAEVVDGVQLVDVFLKSSSSSLHTYPTNVDPSNTSLNIDNNVTYDLTEKHLFCFLKSSVKGVAAKEQGLVKKDDKFFDLEVEIVLAYEVHKSDLDSKAVEMFAANNSLMNGFPFLREALVSMSTRMSIPPVLLPLIKPLKSKKTEAAR